MYIPASFSTIWLATRSIFSASNVTFTALGTTALQVAAIVLFKFVTSFSASLPVAYIDTGGFPITTNGGDIAIQWNAAGIIQAT